MPIYFNNMTFQQKGIFINSQQNILPAVIFVCISFMIFGSARETSEFALIITVLKYPQKHLVPRGKTMSQVNNYVKLTKISRNI